MITKQQYLEELRRIAMQRVPSNGLLNAELKYAPLFSHQGFMFGETHNNRKGPEEVLVNQDVTDRITVAYIAFHEMMHVGQRTMISVLDSLFINESALGHDAKWQDRMRRLGLAPHATGDAVRMAHDLANWEPDLYAKVKALGPVEGLEE